jgi:hypothetical protein
MKRKSPPAVEARPTTHFRPRAFETNFKPTEQEYAIPCGSATSSTRQEQLEAIAFALEGAVSRVCCLPFVRVDF